MRNRDYDKVQDMLDTRVPLHNDEAFQHGIKLKAKVFENMNGLWIICRAFFYLVHRKLRDNQTFWEDGHHYCYAQDKGKCLYLIV